MAHWFYKIVWYGLLTEFCQINCSRNPRPRTSQKELFSHEQKRFMQSREIQSNKQPLEIKLVSKTNINGNVNKKLIDTRNTNNCFDVAPAEIWLNKVNVQAKRVSGNVSRNEYFSKVFSSLKPERKFRKKLKTTNAGAKYVGQHDQYIKERPVCKERKGYKRIRGKRRSDILSAQVVDDDIEDDQAQHSEEISIKKPIKLPKTARYFYRNNKKMLVNKDAKESYDYYKNNNKEIYENGGLHTSQYESDNINQERENFLHREDALEQPNNKGPTFKNTMTWVNMERGDRGWLPKGLHK